MTYCLGIAVDAGLVLASDSRTNAGIDYVTSYSKLHVITPAPDRLFVLLSAGNLATTQEVMNRIRRDLDQAAIRRRTCCRRTICSRLPTTSDGSAWGFSATMARRCRRAA